ncbi:MAG: CapA family protein [Deltaproteobacteria bacterium]|nr:CapA family protein [Deltaproteobacteria bacterium]
MAKDTDKEILLYGVGDIAPDREDPLTIFLQVQDLFNKGDIVFGQLETSFSKRGIRLPQARHAVRVDPKAAAAMKDAGFTVVSFAGNHCMDWGQEAFFDTIESLQKQDIAVIGVGKHIEEARRPALIESKGSRVAFLAYNTILPMAYWAEADRPGCVPLRAWTHYEQIEHDQPGTPCRIHTFPHEEDLGAMVDDITKAKAKADIVIVSMHWGIHLVPAVLAAYQRVMAHVAIDAGADLILGHHAHILKGIEVYKGKVIFYSLCNFAIDLRFDKNLAESKGFKEIQKLNPDWLPEFDHLYNFPRDSQKTIIVKSTIANGAIQKVSFLPTYVDKKTAQPEVLASKDKRFAEVIKYLEDVSKDQGLDTTFNVAGNEVVIEH